jgi:hypothetical protein
MHLSHPRRLVCEADDLAYLYLAEPFHRSG